MEVKTIKQEGSANILTWTSRIKKKQIFLLQPCRYRFALIILIESQTGQEMEECLANKGRKSNAEKGEITKNLLATYNNVEIRKSLATSCRKVQQQNSLFFAAVLNGILFCSVLNDKIFRFFSSFKIRQTAKNIVNSDPYVSRLLLCCKDVESNPGPLPNALVSDDNSSTGSNRSVKTRPATKERAPGASAVAAAERVALREADRISKFERTLIRDNFNI